MRNIIARVARGERVARDVFHAACTAQPGGGVLVLWDEGGDSQHIDADGSYVRLWAAGTVMGIVRAAYVAPRGGHVVALCSARPLWWISVRQPEPSAHITEAIMTADPTARIWLLTPTAHGP